MSHNGQQIENIRVLKFGGTSVKNIGRIQHVADIINKERKNGPILVVVSAMGDTTDYLVKLAKQCREHPEGRELDLLLSTGEQISIALLAMVLHEQGVNARSFTAQQVGIFTESIHNKARIVDIKTNTLLKALETTDVVIVAGFQGITAEGDITTLGRGGSDTTAVALAAAIGAKECDIYTDVDGIYTADPNQIAGAKLLANLAYEEVIEMARLGAQVMHPRAVELARQYKVRLRVRNTFKPAHQGTLINGGEDMEIYRTISGVAVDKDQARVVVLNLPDIPGVAAKITKAVASKNIVIDMIMQSFHATSGLCDICFTVHESDLKNTIDVLTKIKDELGGSGVLYDSDIAKVSLIGAGLAAQPGVAAKVFDTLANTKINIKMIATSEMKLTCVIAKDQADKAANAIHEAFQLETSEV